MACRSPASSTRSARSASGRAAGIASVMGGGRGSPAMAEFELRGGWVGAVVTWVVTALFIHFAARIVLDRSSFLTALLVALVGTVLAFLVGGLVGGTLGIVLAVVTWALVCALFYRTGMLKAAVVGVVAWVLYAVTVWIVERLVD